MAQNAEAASAFDDPDGGQGGGQPALDQYAALFLSNLRHVPTLLTRARFDLVIYGPALVATLASFDEVASATLEGEGAEARIVVTYGDGTLREIRAPEFSSSHSVSRDDPQGLLRAIQEFVERSTQ